MCGRCPMQGNESPMFGNFRPTELQTRVGTLARKSSPYLHVPTTSPTPVRITGYFAYKRCVDVVIGLLLAILLLPVVLLTAILIVISSPGPAFYTQVRLGRFGKPFVIWKLRTMEHLCEENSGAKWSTNGDYRVTPLGRILRRLHIDEFPQLWNVLRGEMSLVGPRPERPEFFPVLSSAVPHYAQRLMVKPGVTGLAQVYLPPDEDVSGVRRKQLYDLFYIRHVGFTFDLRIIVATALQAIGAPHFLVRPFCLLPGRREVEGPRACSSARELTPMKLRSCDIHNTTVAS